MLFSGKENIFQCLVAFQNIFWKIFSSVWLYSWKYSKKPNFIMFLAFSCIFSASKQIYHQLQQNPNSSKPKFSIPNKKNFIKSEISSGQRTTKQEPPTPPEEDWPRASRSAIRRDDLGFDEWCVSGSRRSVTNGFDDGRARRSEEWVRRTRSTIWGMGSTDELDDLRNGFAIWRFGHCSTNELGLGFSGFVGALGCESISPSPLLVRSLFSAVSLSLFYFPGAEVIWSENENGNYFPPLFTLFYGQTEIIFSLTEFSVTAKHPIFRKIIFGISLKSIQTQP